MREDPGNERMMILKKDDDVTDSWLLCDVMFSAIIENKKWRPCLSSVIDLNTTELQQQIDFYSKI